MERAGHEFPGLPALGLGPDVIMDYATLAGRVARLAGALTSSLGLIAGDRVALAMKNTPAYIETLFAVWHAGCAAVPINAKLHTSEFGYILHNSAAKVCFVTPDLETTIAAAAGASLKHIITTGTTAHDALFQADPRQMAIIEPGNLAWLFYTSGTTGQPKGAMLTHRNLTAASLNYFVDFDRINPGDAIVHAAPLSHGSGLWMLPHVCAAACNVLPVSGAFEPDELFSLMPHWPGLAMFAAPTMVRRLTVHPRDTDTSNLKLISYGGAPMYVEDCIAALDRFGPKLTQLYGQGESPMTITHLSREVIADRNHPKWRSRLATAGVADSCIQIAIADESANRLPAGEVGEIICRGDPVMAGYWDNPEATQNALRDGWLWTGDIGHIDPDGYLTLTDRSKDLIISGGANIYPREIEETLLRHPSVAEVSVIGSPHPDWGEEVVAYVVTNPGATASSGELDDLCLQHIARFKRPRRYRIVEALPKNNYGKVLKTELREHENKTLEPLHQG